MAAGVAALVARAVQDALSRDGWVIVCVDCGQVPDTDVPIRHRVAVPDDDSGESGYYACIWDCGHEVHRDDGPCRCTRYPEPEPF